MNISLSEISKSPRKVSRRDTPALQVKLKLVNNKIEPEENTQKISLIKAAKSISAEQRSMYQSFLKEAETPTKIDEAYEDEESSPTSNTTTDEIPDKNSIEILKHLNLPGGLKLVLRNKPGKMPTTVLIIEGNSAVLYDLKTELL